MLHRVASYSLGPLRSLNSLVVVNSLAKSSVTFEIHVYSVLLNLSLL
jgi:hypothetical protein